MKNKSLLMTAGLIIILIAVVILVSSGSKTENVGETASPAPSENAAEAETIDAEETVRTFLDNFMLSAPPEGDKQALKEAVSLLSEGGKRNMKEEPTAGVLARFVGVQDLPDEGYEIAEVEYKDNPATGEEEGLAEVFVTLNYSGAKTEKVFQLSKVGDSWLIDAVN